MKLSARLLTIVGLMTAVLLGAVGCGLISTDFEGDVSITLDFFEPDDNTYQGVERVDPNDYDDYRDNRDRIEEGEIIGITVTFVDVPPENAATYGFGQIDVKRADEPDSAYITAVGEWNEIPIATDNSFPVDLSPTAKGAVDDILFGSSPGAIDLRIVGFADTATISFTARITVELRFTAGI